MSKDITLILATSGTVIKSSKSLKEDNIKIWIQPMRDTVVEDNLIYKIKVQGRDMMLILALEITMGKDLALIPAKD